MNIMVAELENGRMVEVEDIGLTHRYCFSEINDGRIIGVARDADDHNVICIWRAVDDEYKHHVTISLRPSGDGDDLVTITTPTRMHLKLGQPPVCNDMELIIIG